jgi:hypothetical protein
MESLATQEFDPGLTHPVAFAAPAADVVNATQAAVSKQLTTELKSNQREILTLLRHRKSLKAQLHSLPPPA